MSDEPDHLIFEERVGTTRPMTTVTIGERSWSFDDDTTPAELTAILREMAGYQAEPLGHGSMPTRSCGCAGGCSAEIPRRCT